MSDPVKRRIRLLRHKHDQREAKRALDALRRVSDEPLLSTAASAESLELQGALYALLKQLRAAGRLPAERYVTAGEAVRAFMKFALPLGDESLVEFYDGSGRGSGFFVGPLSHTFLLSCLEEWPDGFAVVRPDLNAGVVLDVVADDPVDGDFYEVEHWP